MVFFGTPHFAAIVLEILAAWKGGRLAGVVTQPDRQSGRGHRVIKGECARMAEKLELELYQPASLRNDEAAERLKAMQPDLMVVAAYGLLIPNAILAIPPLGTINVHASLLPAYRGGANCPRHYGKLAARRGHWREHNGGCRGSGCRRGICQKIRAHWQAYLPEPDR
jgi:methionyl-tRNA formyltransferase